MNGRLTRPNELELTSADEMDQHILYQRASATTTILWMTCSILVRVGTTRWLKPFSFFKGTVIEQFLNQKRSEDRSSNGSKTVKWQIKPFNDCSLIKIPFDDRLMTVPFSTVPFVIRSNHSLCFTVLFHSLTVSFLDRSIPWPFRSLTVPGPFLWTVHQKLSILTRV